MSSAVILGVPPVHVVSRLGSLALQAFQEPLVFLFWGEGVAVLSLRCAGLSLAVASRGCSLLWCVSFSLPGFSCC